MTFWKIDDIYSAITYIRNVNILAGIYRNTCGIVKLRCDGRPTFATMTRNADSGYSIDNAGRTDYTYPVIVVFCNKDIKIFINS